MLSEEPFLAACDDVLFVVGFHELVRYPACPDLHLVMEYVGPSITDFLRQQKQGGGGCPLPLPESTVRAVMRQLLTAAAGMHARGVVHRDIKPCNVLVAEDPRVKICDFGLTMSASDRPARRGTGPLKSCWRCPSTMGVWTPGRSAASWRRSSSGGRCSRAYTVTRTRIS
jgi:serine/threonine protein kinase